jgi:hypothetical protein
MFLEALAALENDPSKLLIWPAAAAGSSSKPPVQVPYGLALRAMSVHLYKVGVLHHAQDTVRLLVNLVVVSDLECKYSGLVGRPSTYM